MNRRLLLGPLLSEEECLPLVTGEDARQAAVFGQVSRRREFLTWRTMLYRELGRRTEIVYDAVGAPVLRDGSCQVGVSHCSDRVALLLSDRRCAVDIERLDRCFARLASRYLSPEEEGLADDPRLAAAIWCAKETLYKYAGIRGLSLRDDLHVVRLDFAAGRAVGRIGNGEPVELSVVSLPGHLVVYTL